MAASLTTVSLQDSTGAALPFAVLDESGTGAGPFHFVAAQADANGAVITPAKDSTLTGTSITVNLSGSSSSSAVLSARIKSAATTNATSVKASAGNVFDITASNTSAAAKFLKLYNKASAPTVGTDTPVQTVLLPAGATTMLRFTTYKRFTTGIAYAITGAVGDADTTAVAVDDVTGAINYA